VLRTVNDQPTLWDSILPPELLVLPVELGRVAALLDDPVFFAPFAAYFDARIGRPSIPVETPEPGAGTAFSPTTWSRSVPSQHDIDPQPSTHTSARPQAHHPTNPHQPTGPFFRSK